MSRTWHKQRDAKRGVGKEYGKSRLHRFGESLGRITKLFTHRKERRQSKSLVRSELASLNSLED